MCGSHGGWNEMIFKDPPIQTIPDSTIPWGKGVSVTAPSSSQETLQHLLDSGIPDLLLLEHLELPQSRQTSLSP